MSASCTYCFELTSPHNRIGVVYEDVGVTLLAIRYVGSPAYRYPDVRPPSTAGGGEVALEKGCVSGFGPETSLGARHMLLRPLPITVFMPTPKVWPLRTLEQVVAYANAQDGSASEGCVVVDGQFRRLKVKNRAWALRVGLKESTLVSRRSMLLAILQGVHDDILPLLDATMKAALETLARGVVTFCEETDAQYERFFAEAGDDRKRFAELVNVTQGALAPALFARYAGRTSNCRHFLVYHAKTGKLSSSLVDRVLAALPATPALPEGEA